MKEKPTPPLTDAHLYPLTLGFYAGLEQGTITLDNAWEFCDRVYNAYLVQAVRSRGTVDAPRHYAPVAGLLPAKAPVG